MKVLYILPRNMHFGKRLATSIDLCCRDIIASSVFHDTTHVLASQTEEWFTGFTVHGFPPAMDLTTRARSAYAANYIKELQPDVVVVQQHLPSASAIARKVPNTPVILQRHNFQKAIKGAIWLGHFRRALKVRSYSPLAGITHVSEACDQRFAADWPEVTCPRAVVPNGFPPSHWQPADTRAQEILCVGRSAPEKGILEAAQAVSTLLPELPDWRARFILSNVDTHPDYHRQVLNALGPVLNRATIEVQVPHNDVVAATERAAIALIPSKWDEPFGRTALEAHAGGAAVISSGTGGLREVSGDNALFINDVKPETLVDACRKLIAEQPLREALGQRGHEHVVKHFSISAVTAIADNFLTKICGAHP
ncbi:MAG: glycosyltransferase family 4 protein, partial [Alphaproteobacteria bacterium]